MTLAIRARAANDVLITPEWLAANCDLVIRGRIVDATKMPYTSDQLLSVDVLETLKGQSPPRIKVYSQGFAVHAERDRGAEALLGLRQLGGDTISWQTNADLGNAAILFFGDERRAGLWPRGPLIAPDLRPLRDVGEALAAIRHACASEYAAAMPRYSDDLPLYCGPWDLPLTVDAGAQTPSAVRLPRGAVMEAMALRYAKSTRPELRAIALELLDREGVARRNPQILNEFLDDPAYEDSGTGPWAVRRFLIRERAFDLLSSAGAAGPYPLAEGTLARYVPVRWTRWLFVAAAVVATFVLVALACRHGATTMTASAAPLGVRLLLVILLGGLILCAWIASKYRSAEVVLTTASRHRIASFDGGLQYMFVRNWPEPRALVGATFPRGADADLAWEWSKPSVPLPVLVGPASGPPTRLQLVAIQSQLMNLQYLIQRQKRFAATNPSPSRQLQMQIDRLQGQLDAQVLRVKVIRDQLVASNPSLASTLLPRSGITGSAPISPFIRNRTPSSVHYWLGLTYARGQLTAPDGSARPYTAVRVAYPWLFALPAAVTLLTLRSRLRRRRRITRGLCGNCGYDLRASRDRCPECGTPMPKSTIMVVMDCPGAHA